MCEARDKVPDVTRSLIAAVLVLASAGSGWSLDASAQRSADRYWEILKKNPAASEMVTERLWQLYREAGEEDLLAARSREMAPEFPVISARMLIAAGQVEEAQQILRVAAPERADAAEMVSVLLENQGDLEAASAALDHALRVEATPLRQLRAGHLALRGGESARALAAWEAAAKLAAGDPVLLRQVAVAFAEAGEFERAAALAAALSRPADRVSAWEEISLGLESFGDRGKALAAQEHLLGLLGKGHWKRPEARQRLFALHERAGTLAELRQRWQKEAESRPQDPELALRLAALEAFSGEAQERLRWMIQAGEILPRDVDLARETAGLALSLGRIELAAEWAEKVLSQRPNDEGAIFIAAEAAALQGNETEAENLIVVFLQGRGDEEAAMARAETFYRRLRLEGPLERRLRADFAAQPDSEPAATALLRFLLDHQRYADASELLSGFSEGGSTSREAAATAQRFSTLFLEAGLRAEALEWARRAWDIDPGDPDSALAVADLLNTEGDRDAANAILEKSAAAAPGLPREDLDRRVFLALNGSEASEPETIAGILPAPGRKIPERLAALHAAARDGNSDLAWVRLARWQQWSGEGSSAIAALQEGEERFPESRAIRNALADAYAGQGQIPQAMEVLRQLIRLEPEKKRDYQRRIGTLQLDAEQTEQGLATFHALAKSAPTDWQARADLALAEQRAGNWFQAMETWQQACQLAPPGTRAGLVSSFLNAATRLQLQERALDYFEQAIAREKSPEARQEMLREGLHYARQNGRAANWQARLTRRLAASPEEDFWRLGLAWLQEAEGDSEQAKKNLAELQPGETALAANLAAAEASENWAEAARLLGGQSASPGSYDPAPAMLRAEYLERSGAWEESRAAWSTVANRYARHPEALIAAARFFRRLGEEEKAEAWERQAANLGGCPPRILLRLGRRALERGDRMLALADFEAVLARSRPDPFAARELLPLPEIILQNLMRPSAAVAFLPGGARTHVRAPVLWRQIDEAETEGCRLAAIQESGRLLGNSPDRTAWVEGFTDPVERIWASYHSGDIAVALTEIAALADKEDATPALAQIHAALAMDHGHFVSLRDWALAEPDQASERWTAIVAAFARLVAAGWNPDGDTCLAVMGSAPAFYRWQVALALANQNRFRSACRLGETVPEYLSPEQASAAWWEISSWRMALRDPERVLAGLDQAIARAPLAVAYDNIFFSALRARWLLTPAEGRPEFVSWLESLWEAGGRPASEASSRALLAALAGDDREAARNLKAFFVRREEWGTRDWSELIRQGGARLEEWGLDRLARDLYRQELARDPVIATIRAGDFRGPTEALFARNQISNADPEETLYFLNEWLSRGVTNEQLLHVTSRLLQTGHAEAARKLFTRLSQRSPREPSVVNGMLNLSRLPAFSQAGLSYLEELLADSDWQAPPAVVIAAVLQLADSYGRSGDLARQSALLEQTGVRSSDPRVVEGLILPRVQLLLQRGRFRDAKDLLLSALDRDPSPGLLRPLVELSVGLGEEDAAQAYLERFSSLPASERAEAEARLRELLALSVAPSVLESKPASSADWKQMVATLDHGSQDEKSRFEAGCAFLVGHPDLPQELRARELQRLSALASRNDSFQPAYYVLRKKLAISPEARQALLQNLRKEWDGGRGEYLAGEVLIQVLIEEDASQELEGVLQEYLTERSFNEAAWSQIGMELLQAHHPALAARVFSALLIRRPGDVRRALLLAEALGLSDRMAVADEVVAPIERLALLDPRHRLPLASFYLAVGKLSQAEAELQIAEEHFPGSLELAELWENLADAYLEESNWAAAGEAITRTMTSPQFDPVPVLVRYYAGRGDLETLEPATFIPGLREDQLVEWKLAVAQNLISSGHLERAWLWLEQSPIPMQEPRGRKLLTSLEIKDPERAEKLWKLARESPLWELRVEAAQFDFRRAQAAGSPAVAHSRLAQAHSLHPGSFQIANALAESLLERGDPEAARKVLRELIAAYAMPADRRAAKEMLARLETSPALPAGG